MQNSPLLGSLSTNSLRVVRMLMVETGTYHDMTSRPYQVGRVDRELLSHLQQATQNGHNTQATALSGVSNALLRPTAQPEIDPNMGRPVIHEIANGWNERRLWFMIHLEQYTGNNGSKNVEIVSGFTNGYGVSHQSHAIAPEMTFYVNNVWRFRSVRQQDAHTGAQYDRLIPHNNSHFLGGRYNPANPAMSTQYMRPRDVLQAMAIESTIGGTGELVINTSNTPQGPDRKSRRSHGNPSKYLSEIMTLYSQSKRQHEEMATSAYHDDSPGDVYYSAAGAAQEDHSQYDPFINMINQVGFVENSCFQWSDLSNLFPEVHHDDVTLVMTQGGGQSMRPAHRVMGSDTETWHGTNQETVFASAIANAIPSLMMDNILTELAVVASNRTQTGQFELRPLNARSIVSNIPLEDNVKQVLYRLDTEILPGLTRYNELDLEFEFSFDVLGESRIKVAITGGPMTEFVVPSFADGLFAPVVAGTHQTLSNLSQNLSMILDNIGVDYTPATPQPQGGFNGQGNSGGSQFAL